MRRGLVLVVVGLCLAASASAWTAGLPSPQLVKRLAREGLVVSPARQGDRPRVTVKRALSSLRRAGFALEKPYLVYALRLTVANYRPKFGRPFIDGRLVWLFIVPHVRNPIMGGHCQHDCYFYADMAQVVDATSGRWLLANTLRP